MATGNLDTDASTSLVSIAMPVRNNAGTLATAIRSILGQTYPHWELLLIDDGSSDDTAGVARSFGDPRISVLVDGEWLGLAARLNQAIDRATGVYIARMDGDDIAYPCRLEHQMAYLRAHPDVDLVGAWVLAFRADGIVLGKRAGAERHEVLCARPHHGISLQHPTWLGRAAFFRRYRYETSAHRCEDADLLLRAHRDSRFATVPEVLLGYREEQLRLGKLLNTRGHFVRSMVREFGRRREFGRAAESVAIQGLKAAVDCAAITTGLNYRLLRHRARPITHEDQRDWDRVWRSVQETSDAPVPMAAAVGG